MADIPENDPENGQPLDSAVAKALSAFSENTSRRGVLAAGGRMVLKLLGINAAMMVLLPLDRCSDGGGGGGDNPNCPGGTWANCGQWGAFCPACCGSSYNPTSCPSCTKPGGWWTTCCCCDSCGAGGYNVNYQDCCCNPTGNPSQCSTSSSCVGTVWCKGTAYSQGQPGQPYWCGYNYGQAEYRCTVAVVTATPCTTCNQQGGVYLPS